MKTRIVMLYIVLAVFFGLGIFSLYQFVSPLFFETSEPEEAYAFAELQELARVSENEDSSIIKYDGETLSAKNNDFIGWLMIPDTTISFPIVQGSDNSFYLKHGFDKSYSVYGCPFLDTRTPIGGDTLVIHGHNMGNNRPEIFSPLLNFQDSSYAEQHKSVYFSSYFSNTEHQYELFSVVNFNTNNDFNYLFSEFNDENHRNEYIQFLKNNSLYVTEFVPSGDILVLSTCNRRYGGDNRLLLCFGELEI